MMKADELMALATARSPSLEHIPGGIPILTQQDVMYALACIHHNGASLLLRVKYADQITYFTALNKELYNEILILWEAKKWEKGKNGQLHNMGRMALIEHVSPRICMRCGGWGNDIDHGKVIKCLSCRGTGRKKPSEAGRANRMGISRDKWRYHLSDKYHFIQAILDEWESLGIGRATSKLRA